MPYLRTAVLFALGFLVLYDGRDFGRGPSVPATRSGPEIAGAVAAVRRSSIQGQLELQGELRPVAQTQVVAPLAGRLTEIRFKAGDFVGAGAVVGTISSPDLEARLARQKTALAAARESVRVRETELAAAATGLARAQRLFADDLIARREVEDRQFVFEEKRAQAELARAQLRQEEALLGQLHRLQRFTRVTALTAGRVSRVLAAPGTMVDRHGLIMTLDPGSALKLAAVIDPPLGDLHPGLKAQISTPTLPGVVAHGRIIRAAREDAADGARTAVEIQIDDPPGALQPGIVARAVLDLPTSEALLLIPRTAVVAAGAENYVYKISGTAAVRQPVRLGSEWHNEITVLEGLLEGERVVLDPSTISEGSRARR